MDGVYFFVGFLDKMGGLRPPIMTGGNSEIGEECLFFLKIPHQKKGTVHRNRWGVNKNYLFFLFSWDRMSSHSQTQSHSHSHSNLFLGPDFAYYDDFGGSFAT